jgi:hypothetical protein
LHIGDDIRVKDLPFSEGVEALVADNVAVVRVVAGGIKELIVEDQTVEPEDVPEEETPAE